jgi:DNA polymerase III sliding clamp (beta) subunit (PCNA family)
MRVKVKATDLLSACNEAKPYTKARGLVVDTAIVLRRDAGGPLRVSAGFLHRVTTAIDCEADAPFAAAVDARTLIATLKTLDGDVALSVEPGKLHLNTATLPSIAGDFPKDMPAAKTLGAANATLAIRQIDEVAYAMSKDDTRPRLAAMRFESGYTVASDGSRLAKSASADTRVPDMTLPRAAVPLFRRALKGITGLAVVGPRLCVVRGASTHWFTLNDVPFPPWRQVVPQHYTHTARFDAASLRLSVALLRGDKSTWRFAESACEVSADGCAERIELRAFVVPFSIAMNPAYVADALAHVSGTASTIEMRMNGELDPVVFVVEGSDAIHLVMPMRSRP